MLKTFRRDGVSFRYPSNWTLDADESDGAAWTVALNSGSTAFFLLSLRPDADGPGQVAAEALAALRAEYKEIDAEAAVDSLAGLPAVGHDLDFLTVDTASSAWTRCVDTTAGPLLVLCQVSDYDREEHEPVLRAVCASLAIEDGGAPSEHEA